jgi:hypothetical protein
MVTAVAPRSAHEPTAYELALVQGDLSRLSPDERLAYYSKVCESMGLNPLTRPFEYITLNGKLTLYAKRDATDQLRRLSGVAVTITSRDIQGDIFVVTARALMPDGRTDESIGAVAVKGLQGDALANAYMKAETKAKRRVTLSICGLGWLDETEVETIREAAPAERDIDTDAPRAGRDLLASCLDLWERLGGNSVDFRAEARRRFGKAAKDLTPEQAQDWYAALSDDLNERTDRAAATGDVFEEEAPPPAPRIPAQEHGNPATRPALPATEPQIRAIYTIGRNAQAMDDAEIDARCQELYGVTPAALNRRQASEYIDVLKAGGR